MNTSKRVAESVHQWLHGGDGQFLWVVADTHDEGVDIAHHLLKLKMGEFSDGEIKYDRLPTWAPGVRAGQRAFIFQPEDVQTVLVTMLEVSAEMHERTATPSEQQYYQALTQGIVKPDEVSYLDQHRRTDDFQLRAPDVIFVDIEWPDWENLLRYIGAHTEVKMTDRVKQKPDLKDPS